MKKLALAAVVAVLALSVAAPAFAVGSDGAGREFGEHHSEHASMHGGFSGEMNPGMHRGFSGWMGHEE